jgi:hypothetical protein
MKLIDERTPDGSRHFAELPKTASWKAVHDCVLLLGSANVINYIDEGIASPWLDFSFRGHRFLIHSHENCLRLYVRDPQCSDLILYEVGIHLERLLGTMRDEERGVRGD